VLANPADDFETIGQPGIYPEAQRLYQQQGWTPEMQSHVNNWKRTVADNAMWQPGYGYGVASQLGLGMFDPSIKAANLVQARNPVQAREAVMSFEDTPQAMAERVDPIAAFSALGAANPTSAIAQMLTGAVNTSTLDPVVNNAARRISENFTEQALPALRQGAIMSGQYGGTRQGIAEGIASRGLAYSIGDMAANLYNQAYQQAQQHRYGTANNMAGLGVEVARGNADRDLLAQAKNIEAALQKAAIESDLAKFNASLGTDVDKFNASLGTDVDKFNSGLQLQNNAQQMALQQQRLANRLQGFNVLQGASALQDNLYGRYMGLLQMPSQYNWDNLTRYASIISPGAGIGGTSTTLQPYYTNPLAGALGGALAGAQIAGMTGLMGTGAGAGVGALLGLLSDRRFKTDIERIGVLDNGLGVYRYRYKAGGPVHIGVMADEVKAVKPEAIITIDGVDYVDYGRL
jgi:hypothetical protein